MRSQSGGQPSVNGGSHLLDTELTIERNRLDINLNTRIYTELILSVDWGQGLSVSAGLCVALGLGAHHPVYIYMLLHCIAFIVLCMYVTSSKETGH